MASKHLLSLCFILISISKSDNCNDTTCAHCLDQSSFSSGTFKITTSGKYCLSEDIVFNPNPANTTNPNEPYSSTFPDDAGTYPGCTTLRGGAYSLGYFAALTIEANDVELDLKHKEIRMDSTFYIQQRSFTIIEIGSSPFISGEGPTDFGSNTAVENIHIHDGILGLSSHSGIHSNDGRDITIENIRIYDFETTGLTVNSFNGLTLNNLIIGPSSTQVKPSAYYSSAKYLGYALYQLIHGGSSDIDAQNMSVTFNGQRTVSLDAIYTDLITSLDIAYRWFVGETTDEDRNSELYNASIALYSNPMGLPDGSVLSGIALKGNGQRLRASNIKVMDLKLNNNEVPAAYFTACDTDDDDEVTVLMGPFGDVMDVRRMVGGWEDALTIDLGDDYTELTYVGNPLSDAQIALRLFASDVSSLYGTEGQNAEFLKWALNQYEGEAYEGLPECVQFVCNGDMMFHANKGVIGFRLNEIEDAFIENVVIKRLINKSPLASYACSNYSGVPAMDGRIGGIGTDTKGIAVIGGEVTFDGFNNVVEKLVSYNGDVVGLHIKRDAHVVFDYVFQDEVPETEEDTDTEDDRSAIHIKQLCPAHEITFALLAELLVDGQYPYPNNFYACNVLIDNEYISSVTPYPPNGVNKVWCADYVPQNLEDTIGNVLQVGLMIEEEESAGSSEATAIRSTEEATTTEETTLSGGFPAQRAMDEVLKRNIQDVMKKSPNAPYVYFFIGVVCIIMVVFVLVTFIMKCGKMMFGNGKYSKAKYIDDSDFDDHSDSDVTDEEI